jgi:hypothetical protein
MHARDHTSCLPVGLLPARTRALRGARAQPRASGWRGGCPKRHTAGRFGSANTVRHKCPSLPDGRGLNGAGFPGDRPPAIGASDDPHNFFGPERLSQHVIPSEIEHLGPEIAAGQARCDDDGRRLGERLGSPKDIPPRAIGQGLLTDHDRSELDQIVRVAVSGAGERSTPRFLQDCLKDGPLVVFWSYQQNARLHRRRRMCTFRHFRLRLEPAGAMPFQRPLGKTCAYRQGEMQPILRLWLATTILIGSLMLISETLTAIGISTALGRSALAVSAFLCLLLIMRRWWYKTVSAHVEPLSRVLSAMETRRHPSEPLAPGGDEISKLVDLIRRVCSELNMRREAGLNSDDTIVATSPCRGLSGNLRLAADHVESIRILLEVSQTHQQPIPRAALENLELVSKNLREIQRQLASELPAAYLEGALQLR